jgi:glycosyltransferase involved in cell wall biosynthesis
LKPYVADDRIQVIYNGVAGFGRIPRVRTTFVRIGVLGRIAPEKGQSIFVEAGKLAARHNPDLRFVVCGGPVLAGKDYYDRVLEAADANFTFLDWARDIAAFFDRIDVLVVPSEPVDANPRVIMEAFAAGVPVIAFDSGGIAELIEHNVTGVLVESHTATALAGAIVGVVQRPEQLTGIGDQAYAVWQQRFTLQRFQSEVSVAVEAAADVGRKARQTDPSRLRA